MRKICALIFVLMLFAVFAGAADYSWQEPHAKVLPTGALEWAPKPFVFQAGDTVRYIDYENGDDANDGTTKETAWKHHPWDANAAGTAKAASGPITYVFKRGVMYRGALVGRESGKPENPIRLTSDPTWGEGPAWIVGSQAITGGWKKADASVAPAKMPDPEKNWYIDLPDVDEPWCVWQRDGDEAKRIWIARHPNWEISNPDFVMSEWLAFDGPTRYEVEGEKRAAIGSKRNWDEEFLKDPSASPDRFDGARIWTMWSGGVFSAMGTLYDGVIRDYKPAEGEIERTMMGGAFYFGMGGKGDRYYIERLAEFQDAPGEFYFQPNDGGKGGRLFIRLPEDKDPNQTTVEYGRETMLVKLYDTQNIEISGLRFSFLNVADNYNFPIYPLDMRLPTAVMLYGNCQDVRVANNEFYHSAKAVQARTRITQQWMPEFMGDLGIEERDGIDYMTDISVTDNDITEADHGAISFQGHGQLIVKGSPDHQIGDIEILRNRIHRVNFRPRPPSPGLNIPAIAVDDGTRIHIAGNIITRSWGVGIWITGGKQNSNDLRDRPLIRNYIHHNSVIDSLLVVNDWGAFALWQGGPQYAWGNVAGNPVGPHPHIMDEKESPDRRARNYFESYGHNGYAYYLDGSYKQYVFNNIAWGKANDPDKWFKNRSSQMMVLGFLNQWFNNTFNRFLIGATGSSGTHSSSLANIYADMGTGFISQGISGDISTAYGGEDAADTLRIGLPTLAYAHNIYQGPAFDTKTCFNLGTKGRGAVRVSTNSLDEFRAWLQENGALASQAGYRADEAPFMDAENHDFRPNPEVMKDKKGVRFFVPFSLYKVVGEWDFSINRNNPELIMGQNFYMSDEYISRKMYYDIPRNDLDVPGGNADMFTVGALEDWTESAMIFDGAKNYALLKHAKATADYPRTVAIRYQEKKPGEFWLSTPDDPGPKRDNMRGGQLERWEAANKAWEESEMKVYPGEKRQTVDMDTNNFLVEAYFKTEAGLTGKPIVSKMNGKGYQLEIDGDGNARLLLQADGKEWAQAGSTKINDGNWHHVIAEVDRQAGRINIYVDGKLSQGASSGSAFGADLSISNSGDFMVGKSGDSYFKGQMDFLRVSRGSLADAETTIDEVYTWQFVDGPFLKDFTGRKRQAGKTVPGAIDM